MKESAKLIILIEQFGIDLVAELLEVNEKFNNIYASGILAERIISDLRKSAQLEYIQSKMREPE